MKDVVKTLLVISLIATVIFCSGEISRLITDRYNNALAYLANYMVSGNQILRL